MEHKLASVEAQPNEVRVYMSSCVCSLIGNPELAFAMTRYREVHDFLHVLTALPPTVEGELALKTLEGVQVAYRSHFVPVYCRLIPRDHGADGSANGHAECARRSTKSEGACAYRALLLPICACNSGVGGVHARHPNPPSGC